MRDGTAEFRIAYLVRHDISKQHDMSRVDTHAVTLHSVLNFVDDSAAGGFDTQHLRSFNDVIRCGVFTNDTFRFWSATVQSSENRTDLA